MDAPNKKFAAYGVGAVVVALLGGKVAAYYRIHASSALAKQRKAEAEDSIEFMRELAQAQSSPLRCAVS